MAEPRETIDPALAAEIVSRLASAPYGSRAAVVSDYCAALGWSRNKLYTVAAANGFTSGRQPRADKGELRSLSSDQVTTAAALIYRTRRKTGKFNLATQDAMEMMADAGLVEADTMPHVSTLNRNLRALRMSRRDLARPEPTISMRSEHPNHVHQIDASVCVMWDFKDKKHLVTRDMQTAFYKNKPGFWREVKKVILRYLCVDHATGWLYPRYYYSRGEDFNNIFDFTVHAWGQKEDPQIFPAHGVPRVLMIDKGAANISQFYTNFLRNLQVETYIHTPGKPWINGAVETAHGFWERTFEGQLSFLEIENLDELNTRAADRAAWINATRIHKRTRMTRFQGFSAITSDQLYILPPREICQTFCHSASKCVTVDGYNHIHYEGKRYALATTFRRGDKLFVRWNPREYPAIQVNTQDDFRGEQVASTLIREAGWHFPEAAPVIRKEYRLHKKDPIQHAKEALKKVDISDIKPQLQAPKLAGLNWMPKKGTELVSDVPAAPPMTAHEARKRLRDDLKVDRFTPVQSDWLEARMKTVVTDEQYAQVREEYKTKFIETPEEVRPSKRRFGMIRR